MAADRTNADIPVEVYGYVTDPKLVGYQILTNYESMYWRRLTGRDAWSLYEVLRSFCHEGNATCTPSIKTLMDILGLTDRRQLIGRVDNAPSKQRVLPGLIDVLQEHKLAYAEMKGEGPHLRYIFHVNLNPPALTPKQVEMLPTSLQKKHRQLLDRVSQSSQKLDALEATNRLKPKKTLEGDSEEKGSGTVPLPPGTVPLPPGTVPPKQHPYNITQKTTTVVEEENPKNNNDSEDLESDQNVVVALLEQGISDRVAKRLASQYTQERILDKIDFLEFLLETAPKKVKNPKGWLRRAIEEDYGPPGGYRSRAERDAEAVERERQRHALQRQEEEQEQKRQAERAQKAQEQAKQLAALEETYRTTDELRALWPRLVGELEARLDRGSSTIFHPILAKSALLALTDSEAILVFPDGFGADRVRERLGEMITRLLTRERGGERVSLRFLTLDREAE